MQTTIKGSKFQFNEECMEALKKLKERLTTAPII